MTGNLVVLGDTTLYCLMYVVGQVITSETTESLQNCLNKLYRYSKNWTSDINQAAYVIYDNKR